MQAFLTLYIASIKEFVRSRMTLFWTLAFPVLFVLLFGVLFAGSDDIRFKVGLVVEDRGPTGTLLASTFKQVSAFEISEGAREAELAALRQGDRRAVIVLPVTLSQAVAARQPTPVEIYYDPAQQQTAGIVMGITREILVQTERQITNTPSLLAVEEKAVQAHQLRSIDFLLPGILAMALMQLGLFGTAQPLVQLRDQGVLRRLSATPLPRATVLASQVAHRLTVGLAQTAIILVVGMLLFKVPMPGNWLLMIGFVMLGALMFVSLGYVIAAFARNQESAAGISSILNFPMMFLSGLFFPLDIMPAFLRPVAQANPLTYLADALRQVIVGANPVHSNWVNAGVLAAWLGVSLVVAVRFFKWDNAA